MSTATAEIIHVCEVLPPEKQSEVIDFARFLLEREDDARWERLLAEPQSRPRLDAFLRESAAEATNCLIRGACDLAHTAKFLAGVRVA